MDDRMADGVSQAPVSTFFAKATGDGSKAKKLSTSRKRKKASPKPTRERGASPRPKARSQKPVTKRVFHQAVSIGYLGSLGDFSAKTYNGKDTSYFAQLPYSQRQELLATALKYASISAREKLGGADHKDFHDLYSKFSEKIESQLRFFNPRRASLGTYFRIMFDRQFADYLRRKNCRSQVSLPEEELLPRLPSSRDGDEVLENSERIRRIFDAVNMSPEQREVISLMYGVNCPNRMTLPQIAAYQNVSVGTAKSRLGGALTKLRESENMAELALNLIIA